VPPAGVCLSVDPAPVIKALLHNGAHPNAVAANQATPLHTAAACGNSRAILALHAFSDDLNINAVLPDSLFTALHLAAASSDCRTVTALLEIGACPTSMANHRILPLHIASYLGLPDILELLAPRDGCLPPMQRHLSPLHLVCCTCRPELVQAVLSTLSCVDWLGAIRIEPELMHALADNMRDENLASGRDPHIVHDSRVLQNAAAIQLLRSSNVAHTRRTHSISALNGAEVGASGREGGSATHIGEAKAHAGCCWVPSLAALCSAAAGCTGSGGRSRNDSLLGIVSKSYTPTKRVHH
jgi:ankyrin repeat protein